MKQVCGQCVQLIYQQKSTIVQIVDMCPSCSFGSLDVSHAAFADLVGSYDQATFLGVLHNVTWKEVDCSLLSNDLVFRGKHYQINST
jgi:expansin (peptidoglycan-binding protein)